MSYILNIAAFLILGFSYQTSIPFDELEANFSAGEAKKIMLQCKEKVSITVNNNDGVYSRTQGEMVLGEFFKLNPPASFKFIFKGKDTGASSFAIGTYTSKKEFRITLKFKLEGKAFKIEGITVE